MNDHAPPSRPRFHDVVPILRSTNLQASIDFYCQQLGFELGWKWGEPATVASVCYDKVELNLVVQETEFHPSSVYIYVDQVETVLATWSARGLEVKNPLKEQPYGMKDFEFEDPDGNLICVGESCS